jgi:hypothetical protein
MAEFGPPAVPMAGMMLILRKWKTKSTNPVLAHFLRLRAASGEMRINSADAED